ncbi:MAG: cell division protein ZapA [Desulfobacteraceae bacterium]|nr:cell division protein ZapA [Desulfobacteraceae bacterium]
MDEIVKIELFGKEFRFRPEGDDLDSGKVAEYLKHHVSLAEKQFQFKSSDENKLAILLLAAMNMSKDFHELQTEYSKLEAHVCQRMASLKKKIDEGIR